MCTMLDGAARMKPQTEFDQWDSNSSDVLRQEERDEKLRAAGIKPARSKQPRHEFSPVQISRSLFQRIRSLFS
jgi:hypothetical protein